MTTGIPSEAENYGKALDNWLYNRDKSAARDLLAACFDDLPVPKRGTDTRNNPRRCNSVPEPVVELIKLLKEDHAH